MAFQMFPQALVGRS